MGVFDAKKPTHTHTEARVDTLDTRVRGAAAAEPALEHISVHKKINGEAKALYNVIIITITSKFLDHKRSAKQFIETQIFMGFSGRKNFMRNHRRCHF